METVVIALAALACPVGMGVMGWYMVKGMRKTDQAGQLDVDDLRAEHHRLGAEIERLERSDGNGAKMPAAKR